MKEALEGLPRIPGRRRSSRSTARIRRPESPELADRLDGVEKRIVLEITEHEAIEDYGALAEALAPLRERGLRVAVDDVGAGYASLRHALQLAPDMVKMDISLTSSIDRDAGRRALATALISFAAETNMTIVAEGIETAGELAGAPGARRPVRPGLLPRPARLRWTEPSRTRPPSGRGRGSGAPGDLAGRSGASAARSAASPSRPNGPSLRGGNSVSFHRIRVPSETGWSWISPDPFTHPRWSIDQDPRRLPHAHPHRVPRPDARDPHGRLRLDADALPLLADHLEVGGLEHPVVLMLPVGDQRPDDLGWSGHRVGDLDHDRTSAPRGSTLRRSADQLVRRSIDHEEAPDSFVYCFISIATVIASA